jgi:translation initiation factor 2B subunit (eIF-2B alpha/beta/delta family)
MKMRRTKKALKEFVNKNRTTVLDKKDIKRFEQIIATVARVLRSCSLPTPYGPLNEQRLLRIEEMLYEILPPGRIQGKNKTMDSKHWFLLLSAIWLQDIGMCPLLFGNIDKIREVEKKKDQWLKEVRNDHPERSAEFVGNTAEHLGDLSDNEIKDLQTMCHLHRRKAYLELYSAQSKSNDPAINLPLLIAYLRLADSLHIPDRLSNNNFKIHKLIGVDDTVKFHWFKTLYVLDVIIDPDKHTINIVIKKRKDIDVSRFVEIVRQEMQDELESLREILYKGDLTFYLKVNCEAKDAHLNDKEIRWLNELLTNIQLFDPTLTPSASSVTDIVLKQIEIMIDFKDPESSVKHVYDYSRSVLIDIIKERPCYIMLGKILNMLDYILCRSGDDINKIKMLLKAIRKLKSSRTEALNKIQVNSFDKVFRANSFLVYGFSRTVISCLEHLQTKITRKKTIYVCEARPKTKYRFNNRLIYSDCIKYIEELEKAEKNIRQKNADASNYMSGFNIIKVPDSGVANLFSHKKVEMVLLGANGISLTGDVAHSLGHLSIAVLAANYRIPVYVLANSIKIGNFEKRPDLKRDNEWYTTDLHYAPALSKYEDYNPREDIVPADKIEAIITEQEAIGPSKAYLFEDKNWPERLMSK